MSTDHFRKGQPLGREGLFQLVTDEAFRDGRLDSRELDILRRLAAFLRLDGATARAIAKVSKAKFRATLLGSARPLSPEALYGEAMAFVMSDGRVDPLEERMVLGLRKLFRIDDETDRKARTQALERIAQWRIADSSESIPGEVVASKSRCFDVPTVLAEKEVQAWLEAWIAGDRRVLAEARKKLEEIVEDFRAGRKKGEDIVSILFDLGPLLVDGGAVPDWKTALRVLGEEGIWQRRPALLDCLARRSLALLARRDEVPALVDLLAFHRGLAEKDSSHRCWRAWAGALRVVLRGMALRRAWDDHGRLFDAFAIVPSEARAFVAEDGGRACADLMEQAREDGRWDLVWKGFDGWNVHAEFFGSECIRREYAGALDGLLEAVEKERDGEILDFEKAYAALRELLQAYPADLSVARAFASAAPDALRIFLALEENESLAGLLEDISDLTRRHGADPGVAASLSMGLIEVLEERVPKQRARDASLMEEVDLETDVFQLVLPPEDFAVVAARRILAELLERSPDALEVKGLRERLEAFRNEG